MSNLTMPILKGLEFPATRTPVWDTTVQTSCSGMETRIANQTYPRWKWDLSYSVLRSGSQAEFQTLAGFFNARQGQFDTFLFEDPDDRAVTAQLIAVGNGSTKSFQLIRALGGFLEPILAPHVVSNVYLNAVNQASGWSVSAWGSATPGVLTFVTAPGSGVAISVTYSYYWPCRMATDSVDFANFLSQFYSLKKWSFISVKN